MLDVCCFVTAESLKMCAAELCRQCYPVVRRNSPVTVIYFMYHHVSLNHLSFVAIWVNIVVLPFCLLLKLSLLISLFIMKTLFKLNVPLSPCPLYNICHELNKKSLQISESSNKFQLLKKKRHKEG